MIVDIRHDTAAVRIVLQVKENTVDLITVSPEAAGVGTEPSETKRTVYCTVKSIGMQEAYQAMGIGLNPELKVGPEYKAEVYKALIDTYMEDFMVQQDVEKRLTVGREIRLLLEKM